VATVAQFTPIRANPEPIFVLGNQKSGTSVIAGLLAEVGGLSASIDLRGIYEPIQSRLHSGELPFDQFVRRNRLDFSRAIIKEPSLTLLVDQLDRHFAGARYVFVVRDPRQNIRSILNRLDIPGNLEKFDEEAAAQRVTNWANWQRIIDGRWLGIPYDDYIGALAGRWNMMTDILERNRHRFFLMRYEDFLIDKKSAIIALSRTLDIAERCDIAASVNRQYQRPGDASVTPLQFFGERNLERINRICKRNMERLGYAT
jgi:hypothetical protein